MGGGDKEFTDWDGRKSAPTNCKIEEKCPRGRAGGTPALQGNGDDKEDGALKGRLSKDRRSGGGGGMTREGSWPDLRRGDSIAGRLGSL